MNSMVGCTCRSKAWKRSTSSTLPSGKLELIHRQFNVTRSRMTTFKHPRRSICVCDLFFYQIFDRLTIVTVQPNFFKDSCQLDLPSCWPRSQTDLWLKPLKAKRTYTHRIKNAYSFKDMLNGINHAHFAQNNMKGQPQQTRYASSRKLIISDKCLAYITKAYWMQYNIDTAPRSVDNLSTACTTCSQQILRVSTTLFQHINVPIKIYWQVSTIQKNKPMHIHNSWLGWNLADSDYNRINGFQQK